MTVKELKEYLSNFPDDLRVMIHGYEGGYNDLTGGKQRKIALDVNKAWYYGSHEEADLTIKKGVKIIDALTL